jgi:hypothetical protein
MKVYKLTVTTEWLDEETGEIIKETRELKDDTIKKPRSSSSSSKSKIQENPNPILTLEDNKYILTTGAVELLGVEAGDKIDIKFQKVGKQTIPVIGSDEAFGTKGGNKLTKTNTVSCRGKANEELSAFGTEFTLEEHPNKSGLFILRGENTPNVSPEATKKQPEPEDEDEIKLDEDLENEEEDTLEISDDDFNFDEF